MFQVKRVYEPVSPGDGSRFLVDRLWPRGVKREALRLTGWIKEVAPSNELRNWYGHDPERWPEFQRRYFAELDRMPETWKPLLEAGRTGTVTLLFGSRELNLNNATALKIYLERH